MNAKPFIIEDELMKHLKEGRKEWKVTSWQASRIGMCPCGIYLERMGVEPDEDFDDRTLRVFKAGNLFEDFIISLLPGAELQKRIEWKEQDVTGYADAIFNGLVYEIKSKHSRAFWHMDKQGDANQQHKMQLWIYLKVLNMPEGRILYCSKDDLAIREYPIFLEDKELEEKVMHELNILNEAWKTKTPPQPITDKKDWRYKYCRYHKKCLATLKDNK